MKEQHKAGQHGKHDQHSVNHRPYLALLVSLAVSYVAMYAIMYSMADRWSHVYFNLSNAYMTGLMAGSMLPIMLATMPGMFKDRKVNAALWVTSVAVLALFWILLRYEAGVGDRQFLRAMIPHHSAAIQMCNESSLTDSRVKKLCEEIVAAQEREIAEMKALLAERK
jgi:FtsH-binding integral membrane protein